MTGRVTDEAGQPPTIQSARVRVTPRPLDGSQGFAPPGGGGAGPDNGRVRDDWSFSAVVQGPARLRATVPDGVIVKAIVQDGRDISDNVIDLPSGQTLDRVQIVLSTKVTSVIGQLTDDKGAPLPDGTILVFSTDADKWSEDSRFVKSARPDQQGKYEVRGLPPGEYLAVAVDYVEEGSWNDPEYLESIRRFGQRLKLGEGDAQTVSLKLIATP